MKARQKANLPGQWQAKATGKQKAAPIQHHAAAAEVALPLKTIHQAKLQAWLKDGTEKSRKNQKAALKQKAAPILKSKWRVKQALIPKVFPAHIQPQKEPVKA